MPMQTIDQNLQMKMAYIKDTTIYTPAAESPVSFLVSSASYTFTPATENNVILGFLWRCTLTTGASFAQAFARLSIDPPTDTVQMDEYFNASNTFYATDQGTTNVTPWMWWAISNENPVQPITAIGNWRSQALSAGQTSYTIKLYTGRRSTSDNIKDIEIKVFYIDKATYGCATLVKV